MTTLPKGLFADLRSLQWLQLEGNDLTALPPGTFLGLSSLRSLQLRDNRGTTFRLALRLEPDNEAKELVDVLSATTPTTVKLTLHEGAPYPLTLELTVSGVELSADQVTIPAGSTQSVAFIVTRITGKDRVRIDFSEPPPPPNNCPDGWRSQGQCFNGFEIVGMPTIDFVYDGRGPQVSTIRFTSTPQSSEGYMEGETISVDVVFDRVLVIVPQGTTSPTLTLQIGTNRRTAAYSNDDATAGVLSFVYPVTTGDLDEDGVSVAQNGLRLNDVSITDVVYGLPANLELEDGFLADFPRQKVRAVPRVSFDDGGGQISREEGTTVNAVFRFDVAMPVPITIRYTIDHDTADAEDYVAGNGEVIVPAGATSGTIVIFIVDDEDIEPARETFDVNLVVSDGYIVAMDRSELEIIIEEGTCDRTPRISDSLERIVGADSCSGVSGDGLKGESRIVLSNQGITALKEKDFLQLENLEVLFLHDNELTTLPEGAFAGFDALRILTLHDNQLTTLPGGAFAGLDALELLTLYRNQLTTLPPGAFSGLSSLRSLRLHDNPGTPFRLALSLEPVDEAANVNPERLTSLLSTFEPATVRLTLHEGAPYPLALEVTASGVELSTYQVTIPAGGTRSEAFTATRITGEDRVRIALSEPPRPPDDCPTEGDWNHEGPCFSGFEIVGDPIINFVYDEMAPRVTTIRFTSTPQDPDGYARGETINVDVVFDRGLVIPPIMEGSSSPTLALQIGTNRRTATYVVESNAGDGVLSFVYPVTAGDFDDNGVSVARDGLQLNDVDVTEPVLDQPANVELKGDLLADFPGHKVYGSLLSVSFEESEIRPDEGATVNAVFKLDVAVAMPIAVRYTLEPGTADAGDYEAGSGAGSGEVVVPAGATSGTVQIFIVDDDLIERPRDTFSLNLVDSDGYALGSSTRIEISIREGVCDRTPQVRDGIVGSINGVSDCTDVTDDHLSGMTGIFPLGAWTDWGGDIATLKAGDFSGLVNLTGLGFGENQLSTLPATVFSGLAKLTNLGLRNNRLSILPATVFSGLVNLEKLVLHANRLTALPTGVFSGLGNLEGLFLHANRLTTLPPGTFSGLSSLRALRLHDNPRDNPVAFRLALRLELADEAANVNLKRLTSLLSTSEPATVKLTLREGAPYPLEFDVTASGVRLSTDSVTIPTGGTQSATFTMTRIMEETRVRITFSEPPSPPTDCLEELKLATQCFTGFEIAGAPAINFAYDGKVPQVSTIRFISTPQDPNGYVRGETINVDVVFDRGLAITPAAPDSSSLTLALQIGTNRRTATYADGTAAGAGILSFVYRVAAGDFDDNGVSVAQDGLRLNGVAVTDVVSGTPVNVGVDGFLADFPEQKVRDLPLVSFEDSDGEIRPDEGTTIEAVFRLDVAAPVPTTIRYTFDHDTADAADYVSGNGEVVVPAGATRGTIRIFIVDDELIERARDRFSLNLVDSDGYALGPSARIEVFIREGVCDRTPQVAEAIRQSGGQSHCSDVTNPELTTRLSIVGNPGLTTLKERDFFELDGLQRLDLNGNELATLPEGAFAGLGALELLALNDNELTTLPEGVFAGLGTLELLALNDNELTTLPEGTFDDLGTTLQQLRLDGNRLTELPPSLFAGLGALELLTLNDNELTTLPEGAFAGLGALELLTLYRNRLTTLSPGTFSGLSSLRSLRLHDNPGAPFRLTLGLEPTDEAANVNPERLTSLLSTPHPATVKLTLREGAPYPLALALTASGAELSTDQVAMPAGSTRSMAFTATRNMDENRVRIALSEPPRPPDDCPTEGDWNHEGPCFSGFEIAGDPIINFVYDGMTPQVSTIRFISTPQDPDGYVRGEAISVDVVFDGGLAITPAIPDSSSLTLALQIGTNRRTATYADGTAAGAGILSFVYRVAAGDFDDNGVSVAQDGLRLNGVAVTDVVSGTPVNVGVDGFLADFPEQKVRDLPLASFEDSDGEIRSDEGTTIEAVFRLDVAVPVPTIVRYALEPGTADADDYEAGSGEVVVPAGATGGTIRIFIVDDELIERVRDTFSLNLVDSDGYALGPSAKIEVFIREGVCDRTPQVAEAIRQSGGQSHCSDVSNLELITRLSIADTPSLTTLKGRDFFELDGLQHLDLNSNGLTTLPEGVFAGLGSLRTLTLHDNLLAELPPGLFAALGSLQTLQLSSNRLTALPPGLFAALGSLQTLTLHDNLLAELPPGVFAALGSLQALQLSSNRLTALPPGAFSGLSRLSALHLRDNPGSTFGLRLRLETTVEEERLSALFASYDPIPFMLTLLEGAPYPLQVSLTVSGGELSTDRVMISAGGTYSETITATRFLAARSVRVAFFDAPSPPPNECADSDKLQGRCFTGFEIVPANLADNPLVLDKDFAVVSNVTITSSPFEGRDAYVGGDPDEEIVVELEFSGAVEVIPAGDGSLPTLALEVGDVTRLAAYDAAASFPDRLVFRYKPQDDDVDDDGISVPEGALRLNGARILDADVPVPPSSLSLGNHAIQNAPDHKVRSAGVNLKIRVFLEGALE